VETHVKERLTGALILVALLVILVPEILPGPVAERAATDPKPAAAADGPPLRTYSMELGAGNRSGQPDQSALAPQAPAASAAPSQADEPPRDTDRVPEPADRGKPDGAGRETPQAVASAAHVETPPQRTEMPTPAAGWWVQLGSFSQPANAQRLVQTLTKAGFAAQVSPIRSRGQDLYRVRAGPVPDRAAAEGLRTRLADAGHKGTLVAP
jgi:DedD protein